MKTRDKNQGLPSESTENVGNSSENATESKKAMTSTEKSGKFRKKLYTTTKAHEFVKAKDRKCQLEQYAVPWLKRENYKYLQKLINRDKKQEKRENKDKNYLC